MARDVRTGGYIRTESGNRWLEVSAVVQRIVTLANQAGSVGPGRGGSVLGRATSVCAMPSPSRSCSGNWITSRDRNGRSSWRASSNRDNYY